MLKLLNGGALSLLLIAGTCLAQNPETLKFYKLDFVVREVEGSKVLNARAYSMTVSTDSGGNSIRTGSRIPAPTSPTTTSMIEVGTNIDCSAIHEVSGQVSLRLTAEISSTVQEPAAPTAMPIIRQNRWTSTILVPIKKPTVVFSSDDVSTKRQMQLEVTATPIP